MIKLNKQLAGKEKKNPAMEQSHHDYRGKFDLTKKSDTSTI